MENKDWTIAEVGGDNIYLERGISERKTVKRPKHMTKPEWARTFRPGTSINENTLAYLLKKK
jgi:hypothetical protein